MYHSVCCTCGKLNLLMNQHSWLFHKTITQALACKNVAFDNTAAATFLCNT